MKIVKKKKERSSKFVMTGTINTLFFLLCLTNREWFLWKQLFHKASELWHLFLIHPVCRCNQFSVFCVVVLCHAFSSLCTWVGPWDNVTHYCLIPSEMVHINSKWCLLTWYSMSCDCVFICFRFTTLGSTHLSHSFSFSLVMCHVHHTKPKLFWRLLKLNQM